MSPNKRMNSVCVSAVFLFVGCLLISCSATQGTVSKRTPDVLALGRSADPETLLEQFKANVQIWKDLNIAHYEYDVEVIFFCPELYMDYEYPTTIVVRNEGSSVSLVDKNGIELRGHARECMRNFDSINRIIGFTGYSIQHDPDYIKIKYDPIYGMPVEVDLDYNLNEMHDDLHLIISRFIVLEEK